MRASGIFDVIICGGGPAGLSTAILLADKGYHVALFEKKRYPAHKVCGEYLSKETGPLLERMGIDLVSSGAKDINELHISTVAGKQLHSSLTQGAWGISRYTLDQLLFMKAGSKGVVIFQDEAVRGILNEREVFGVKTESGICYGKKVIGAFGKRDVLDRALRRDFLKAHTGYMAVKHHLRTDYPDGKIGLYPFKNGFAGIVNVEDGRTCLCYLMKRENMKGYKTIDEMEQKILSKNPFLEKILCNSEKLYEAPLVINEISFSMKDLYKDEIYFTGDSAAMIAPVCGNGMAMAFKGAEILSDSVEMSLNGDDAKASVYYRQRWSKEFSSRLRNGRMLQDLLMNDKMIDLVIPVLNVFPSFTRQVIKMTHGKQAGKLEGSWNPTT